jgi:hypothetical protein
VRWPVLVCASAAGKMGFLNGNGGRIFNFDFGGGARRVPKCAAKERV